MIYDCKQRSEEWFDRRLGNATCSRLNDVLAKRKDMQEAAARRDYRLELVTERLTMRPVDHFVTRVMQTGTENEPLALTEYEFRTGYVVKPIGLATHPKIRRFSGSPDGLVEDGLLEIKCLKPEHHTQILISRIVPADYLNQIFGQLSCTERDWCDFVSYCPDMPEDLQIFIARVGRHEATIRGIETEVSCFLEGVEAAYQSLRKTNEDTKCQPVPIAARG